MTPYVFERAETGGVRIIDATTGERSIFIPKYLAQELADFFKSEEAHGSD